ncbi:MAG: hypothetical protein U0736_18250 [Gemmataceae bacterium]
MYCRKSAGTVQWKSRLARTAALVALLSAGCRQVVPPPDPPPHQGATVRVACPPEVAELVAVQARAWQARQQARVEVVPLPAGKPADTDGRADVWVIRPADLPHWVAAGRLHRLPETFTARGAAFDWGGLLPVYRQNLLVWQQVPYAVPLQGEANVCVYRSDLFAAPEVRQRFRDWQAGKKRAGPPRPLTPPLTWEEFAEQAEFFRDHHPAGRPGPSLPPLPAAATDLDEQFYVVAAGYARRAVRQDEAPAPDTLDALFSFQYDQKTGEPRIAGPGFVAGLRTLVRLQACRPGDRARGRPTPSWSGQAVLGVIRADELQRLQQAKRSATGSASPSCRGCSHLHRGRSRAGAAAGVQPHSVPGRRRVAGGGADVGPVGRGGVRPAG